eukprot:4319594-Pyramimonas_sp.AAC.1
MAKSVGLWGEGANLDLCWCLVPSRDPISRSGASLRRYCAECWSATDPLLCAKDNLVARELREDFSLAKERFDAQPPSRTMASSHPEPPFRTCFTGASKPVGFLWTPPVFARQVASSATLRSPRQPRFLTS